MFIPLSAGKRTYPGLPWATLLIFSVNISVFFWELWLNFNFGEDALWQAIRTWGFTPGLIDAGVGPRAFTALSSMFMHGSLSHIFFNLLFFAVFAPPVEELTGSWRFLTFYLCAGMCGNALTLLLDRASLIPGIGASGAIAGVMGAFLLVYPGRRVRTLLFVGVPLWPRVPAWVLLGLWILDQAVAAQAVIDIGFNFTGIGIWAHLGGFAGGLLLVTLFLRPDVLFNRRGAV